MIDVLGVHGDDVEGLEAQVGTASAKIRDTLGALGANVGNVLAIR